MNNEHPANEDSQQADQSKSLSAVQRRVLGVLAEKAKTTPDAYPLTLNAVTTACNQKSNRNPQMDLKSNEVEDVIDELRKMKAVAEVHGSGRTAKYKHYLYEWLGVDKVELAIMAELLLRGEQSIGDLRGRAARMEPIEDVATLKPILASLIERGLVIELTPPGRGQLVTHGLYQEQELVQIRNSVGSSDSSVRKAPAERSAVSHRVPSPSELEQLKQRIAKLEQTVETILKKIDGDGPFVD